MARSLAGNLRGAAAHGVDELTELRQERTETDVRIGKKISRVKTLMGDDFLAWYVTTPFTNAALERALDAKLAELEARDG